MGCVIPTHLHITIIKLTLNPHTMNLHQLWLITQYSFTEIWRNKTFRVAFIVLIPLLIAYQVSFQSDMFNIPVEYTLVLSSFIPTQNAYMFNLLLVFPLATMGFWVHKQKNTTRWKPCSFTRKETIPTRQALYSGSSLPS